MEDTTGIDITQHPEFKRLQGELAAVVEDLKKKDDQNKKLLEEMDYQIKTNKSYKS